MSDSISVSCISSTLSLLVSLNLHVRIFNGWRNKWLQRIYYILKAALRWNSGCKQSQVLALLAQSMTHETWRCLCALAGNTRRGRRVSAKKRRKVPSKAGWSQQASAGVWKRSRGATSKPSLTLQSGRAAGAKAWAGRKGSACQGTTRHQTGRSKAVKPRKNFSGIVCMGSGLCMGTIKSVWQGKGWLF